MIPGRAPSSFAQVGDVRWIYWYLAEADRWSLSLHFWWALSATSSYVPAGFMKAVQSFAASALGMIYTEVLFQRSPTLNLNHMNRRGVVINLEGARMDGNHCKSLWLPSGMIMWRTCWCGTWMARGSYLTYRHNGQTVCLQRTNFTSARWGVVMTWSSHLSATSHALVEGWWEGKEVIAQQRQKVPSLFWEEVLSQLLLSNCYLQAFHRESFWVPHLSFPQSKHC